MGGDEICVLETLSPSKVAIYTSKLKSWNNGKMFLLRAAKNFAAKKLSILVLLILVPKIVDICVKTFDK